MKTIKTLSVLLLSVLLITISCKKKDDPKEPDPAPAVKYSVEYKVDITGKYENLELIYMDQEQKRVKVENPNFPWERTLNDFKSGDSVLIEFSYLIKAFDTASYFYQYYAHGNDGSISCDNGTSDTIKNPAIDMPVKISDGCKIN